MLENIEKIFIDKFKRLFGNPINSTGTKGDKTNTFGKQLEYRCK